MRVGSHYLPYHRVLPREAPGANALAVRPPCLAARDALGSEGEGHIGGFAAANGDVLGLHGNLAVDDGFRTQAIHEGLAGFEGRGGEGAALRGRTRRIAVHRQLGFGGQGHHDGGRSARRSFFALLLLFFLRHHLDFFARRGGAAGAAVSARRSATVAIVMATVAAVATRTQAAEETAVAAVAAAVAAVRHGMATAVAAIAAVAAMATVAAIAAVATAVAAIVATVATMPAEQSAVAAIAAMAMTRNGMAAVRAGAAVTTTTAEINRFGAARQGHHQNNAVHFGNLQNNKGANPEQKYQEPLRAWSLERLPKSARHPVSPFVSTAFHLTKIAFCDG